MLVQGPVGFAADDVGLTGPRAYLLFAAFDGMAAFFATVAYRWARQGAAGSGSGRRLMVLLIVTDSAWFQWEHAADRPLAARAA